MRANSPSWAGTRHTTSVVHRSRILVFKSQYYLRCWTYILLIQILNCLRDRFVFKFFFIASNICWTYQHLFLWAVKLHYFYAYPCTFYYIRYDLVLFHIMLYSITYVNFCLGILHFERFLVVLFASILKTHIKVLAQFNYGLIFLTVLFVW